MPPKIEPRDVGPVLKTLRNLLLGRELNNNVRFAPFLSKRTQPQPELPDGVSHKHSDNYYYARDARREVTPPIEVTQNLLTASGSKGDSAALHPKLPTPGKIYRWDEHSFPKNAVSK